MKVTSLAGYGYRRMIMHLNDGNDAWVRFASPQETRRGSIGFVKRQKLSPYSLKELEAARIRFKGWYDGHADTKHYDSGLVIEFPGTEYKPIKLGPSYNFELLDWLYGYTGPAVRVNTPREAPKIPEHKDQFGEIAKIGDFIGFVRRETLTFGTITRFSPGGNIYFRTIDAAESYFVGQQNFAIIDKDFRNRLMIHKLTKR